MNPKISVLMSVHNGEAFLKEAIGSILNQSFTDFEFILINDSSTDSSKQIIESSYDPRIVLINNETNLGLTKSLNIGLSKASGMYIARMDADDVSSPDRFQKQYDYMEANPNTWVVGSSINIMNDEGYVVKKNEYPESFEEILGTVFFKNPIVHSTAFFRREEILKIGGYNNDYKKSQDYELWLRIIKNKGVLANLPEALVNFRVHSSSITQSSATTSEQEANALMTLQGSLKEILDINVEPETLKLFRYISLHNNSKISLGGYSKLQSFIIELRLKFKEYTESVGKEVTIDNAKANESFNNNLTIFKNNLRFGVVNTIFKKSLN
jgi:glycosyltransferase involved in cell wall biosynthesis